MTDADAWIAGLRPVVIPPYAESVAFVCEQERASPYPEVRHALAKLTAAIACKDERGASGAAYEVGRLVHTVWPHDEETRDRYTGVLLHWELVA